MTESADQEIEAPGAGFKESQIEADGFSLRVLEAGKGDALVCLHGDGGLQLTRTHDMLAESYRVVALEIPGFGASPVNDRSGSMQELAGTLVAAVSKLGFERFNLIGHAFGAKLALWMAIAAPEAVMAAVLIAPSAIRLDGPAPAPASAEEATALLYAHPERQPAATPLAPEIEEKQRTLVERLIGPPRDAELEGKLAGLEVPVLALFGTKDRINPPEAAHLYCEILPDCHLVMVYDAAHMIGADRPEALTAVVADYLERHGSFLVKESSGLIHP